LVSEQFPSGKQFNYWKEIMDHARVGIPQFNGERYALWSKKIQTYIHAHGFDVWKSVVDGYCYPIS
jgi:hypothetical protein